MPLISLSTITGLIMLVLALSPQGADIFEERKMPAKLSLFDSISPIPFQNGIESMKCQSCLGVYTEQVSLSA